MGAAIERPRDRRRARVPRGDRARDVLQRHRSALGGAPYDVSSAIAGRSSTPPASGCSSIARPVDPWHWTTTSTTATPSRPTDGGCGAVSSTVLRPPMRARRPWPLRTSDFDVLDHVNNARSLEAVEDELARCLPGRVPVRAAPRVPRHARARRRGRARQHAQPRRARRRAGRRAHGVARGRGRRAGLGHRDRAGSPRTEPGGRLHWPRSGPLIVDAVSGRRCVVTGGLGFIGANLALALAEGGAEVTVIDARVARHGANPWNLVPDGDRTDADDRIAVVEADIGATDRPDVRDATVAADVVFNLAGQVSHVDSMDDPLFDLDVNTTSQFALPRAAASREPERDRRVHVDAPDLRQAAVPPRRRGPPGRAGRRQRHHEVRDRAAAPPLPRRLRARSDGGAAHQRVRPASAPA